MATKYAVQQQGVADGSAVPADKADGRLVNARAKFLVASKEAGVAWNSGDEIYLGKKPAGATVVDVKVCTDTSFSTTTLDVGIGDADGPTTGDKYVDGATNTVTNKMVSIGPNAAVLDDDPPGEEHLWLTVGTANIGAAVVASIVFEFANQN